MEKGQGMNESTNEITAQELATIRDDIQRQLRWLWSGMNSLRVSKEVRDKLRLDDIQKCIEEAIGVIEKESGR